MSKQLNPKSHRVTESNERRTQERIAQYYGKADLLKTWETQPEKVRMRNHAYILKLRARLRMVKNLVMHRASPDADLG